MRLEGKVAIVSGAASGMGAATARRFAKEGAKVVIADMLEEDGAKIAADITRANGTAEFMRLNVTNEADWKSVVDATVQKYGKLDILVNNAGVYEFAPLGTVTSEHFHKLFDLNVLGLILATQEALKLIGEGGSIINISSVAGPMPVATGSVYSATKAAVDAVTVALSKELGPRKIRVNSLNPGLVLTEGVHSAGIDESDFRKGIESQTPLGRVGQPEDVARAAVFFASDEAGWITGQSLLVSGGFRA
jgi:3-oxoacyl-[acyl-carrier protein] reductase